MVHELSKIFSLISIFVGLLNVAKSDSFLEKIEFECNRQCDTHFSGADCWEKTFKYFTNHLLQSLVDYANAESISRAQFQGSQELLYSTYLDYKTLPDVADFLENIVPEFEQIFNFTLNKIPLLAPNNLSDKDIKCPIVCNSDSLIVWIALFSVFVGLTLAAIVAVAVYIGFIKSKHRHIEKLSKT